MVTPVAAVPTQGNSREGGGIRVSVGTYRSPGELTMIFALELAGLALSTAASVARIWRSRA